MPVKHFDEDQVIEILHMLVTPDRSVSKDDARLVGMVNKRDAFARSPHLGTDILSACDVGGRQCLNMPGKLIPEALPSTDNVDGRAPQFGTELIGFRLIEMRQMSMDIGSSSLRCYRSVGS